MAHCGSLTNTDCETCQRQRCDFCTRTLHCSNPEERSCSINYIGLDESCPAGPSGGNGVFIGALVGSIVFALVLIVVVIVFIRRRAVRRRRAAAEAVEETPAPAAVIQLPPQQAYYYPQYYGQASYPSGSAYQGPPAAQAQAEPAGPPPAQLNQPVPFTGPAPPSEVSAAPSAAQPVVGVKPEAVSQLRQQLRETESSNRELNDRIHIIQAALRAKEDARLRDGRELSPPTSPHEPREGALAETREAQPEARPPHFAP